MFAQWLLPIAMKKHRAIEPSMLQDLKRGKICEIDAINGVVCQWGRKCGIPTPINDRIVEIIKRNRQASCLWQKRISVFLMIYYKKADIKREFMLLLGKICFAIYGYLY